MKNSIIVAAFATLFSLCGQVPAAEPKSAEQYAAYAASAKACSDCQLQCDMCFKHCLKMAADNKTEHCQPAQLCVDCAECCKLAACLTARKSTLSPEACDCCAKCCDKCAEACEKFTEDKHMIECAKCCRDCAKACRIIQDVSK